MLTLPIPEWAYVGLSNNKFDVNAAIASERVSFTNADNVVELATRGGEPVDTPDNCSHHSSGGSYCRALLHLLLLESKS